MTDAAERDQGVTDPGPCHDHGEACGVYGCKACIRAAFAEWLVFIGERRVCDGSGMREQRVACPGCGACATAETPCPAFALPDEPWISAEERAKPCVFCDSPQAKHRRAPPLPESEPAPAGIAGWKIYGPDETPEARPLILGGTPLATKLVLR